MTVDFHVHSTASDGTFAPRELVAKAAKGGFAAIALTDHDNLDGADEFMSAGARLGVRTVVGVELSVEPGDGFDRFHLLGLGVDPANAALQAFRRRILDGRNARNARILENFRRLGIEMGGEIAAYAHGDVLARPHFARWLMEHGYAKSIAEAFETYLLPESPDATRCYEERWHPPQEEAFAVVHAAGGLCVMAHPRYWRRTWQYAGCDFAAAERGLAALKEKGLDGLEALYRANRPEENVGFARLASRLGLLKSAGSDFHGANKPSIPLGMRVTGDFAAPLLERLPDSRAGRPSRTDCDIIRDTMEEKIKAKLEELRTGLQSDGGDLELVKIDGKVVYLKLVGHCGSCPFAMMTLKQGIEAGLQEIDPEITVERVEA